MADNTYQRAVKPLTFGIVSKKAGVKADTFSKVRAIQKIKTKISFANQVINVTAAGAAKLIYQTNFSLSNHLRILNWQRLQAKLAPDISIASINDVVICVKFIRDNEVYRYKIAGRKEGEWEATTGFPYTLEFDYARDGQEIDTYQTGYACSAPWYQGEKIEPNFVIEIWSAHNTKTTFTLTGNLELECSYLSVPSSLTETELSATGAGYTQADLGFNFPIALPFNFPAPTVGN